MGTFLNLGLSGGCIKKCSLYFFDRWQSKSGQYMIQSIKMGRKMFFPGTQL